MGGRKATGFGASGTCQGQARQFDRARGPPLRLYADTSALVKLYVEEAGSAPVRAQIGEAAVVATSSIAYVEARAALARRRRAGDFSAGEHRRVVGELDADWERYVRLEVTSELIREAAALADRHHLRAYDAIHLASAVTARRQLGGDLVFACWDDGLNTVASREGFELARR